MSSTEDSVESSLSIVIEDSSGKKIKKKGKCKETINDEKKEDSDEKKKHKHKHKHHHDDDDDDNDKDEINSKKEKKLSSSKEKEKEAEKDKKPKKKKSKEKLSSSKEKKKKKANEENNNDEFTSSAGGTTKSTKDLVIYGTTYSLKEENEWQDQYSRTARENLADPEVQEPILEKLADMVREWVDATNAEYKKGGSITMVEGVGEEITDPHQIGGDPSDPLERRSSVSAPVSIDAMLDIKEENKCATCRSPFTFYRWKKNCTRCNSNVCGSCLSDTLCRDCIRISASIELNTHRKEILWLNPRTHSDLGLLHFLRKYKFNIKPAFRAVRDDIFWRCARNTDGLEEDVLDNPIKKAFDDYLPFVWHGVDKLGKKVFVLRMGLVDVKKLMSVPHGDAFDYINLQYEYLQRNIYRISPAIAALDATCIIDCTGLQWKSVYELSKHTSFARSITGIPQLHYPDLLNKAFVINAPAGVQKMWSVAQKFMTHSIRRLVFLSDNYKEELLEWIDADQLPIEYGGVCECMGKSIPCVAMPGENLNVPHFEKTNLSKKNPAYSLDIEVKKGNVIEYHFYTDKNKIGVEVRGEDEIVKEREEYISHTRSIYRRFTAKKDGLYSIVFDTEAKTEKLHFYAQLYKEDS